MPVKLYYNIASPPSRAVLLTLKLLNIPHELHFTDVTKEEHKTEEFLKINPQHKLPTIVDDDGFIVQDSHAINAYLVGKYGKDDKLYPKDIKARSVVDHRLHFDTGVLWQAFAFVNTRIFYWKTITSITPEIVVLFEDAYNTLEQLLSATGEYIAGNQVTIADISVITSLANLSMYVFIEKEKYRLLTAYIERCQTNIPFCGEMNKKGFQAFRVYLNNVNFQLPSQYNYI